MGSLGNTLFHDRRQNLRALGQIALGQIALDQIALGQIALGQIALGQIALDRTPSASVIEVVYPGGRRLSCSAEARVLRTRQNVISSPTMLTPTPFTAALFSPALLAATQLRAES